MNRKAKEKRRPNSAVSGATALGSISRRMIHHSPSPRTFATSTYSSAAIFIASARDRRNTRVESRIAIVAISTGNSVPSTERMMKAKIRVGIDSSRSTNRDSSVSAQPRSTAAAKPVVIPIANEMQVITSDRPIDMRAPYSIRLKRSRPRLSRPSQCIASGSAQASPTTSA